MKFKLDPTDEARLVQLVAHSGRIAVALERLAGALGAESLMVDEKAIADTLANGGTIRKTARLHGTTIGRVRGIKKKAGL